MQPAIVHIILCNPCMKLAADITGAPKHAHGGAYGKHGKHHGPQKHGHGKGAYGKKHGHGALHFRVSCCCTLSRGFWLGMLLGNI